MDLFDIFKWIYDNTVGIRKYRLNREFISFCKDRNLNGVESALARGADINFKDEHGKSALIIAVSMDIDGGRVPTASFDLVELLLRYEPDEGRNRINVDARDNEQNTALIMASRNGAARIVEVLINAGANVNAQNGINRKGWTGLMRAVKHGYSKTAAVFKRLLSSSAWDHLREITNNDGDKAIDILIKNRDEIIRNRGASVYNELLDLLI